MRISDIWQGTDIRKIVKHNFLSNITLPVKTIKEETLISLKLGDGYNNQVQQGNIKQIDGQQ